MSQKSYYLPEIRTKIERYCAYQERCQSEVRQKLYDLGVSSTVHDLIISELIQKNFLNEQRFAQAFVSGKFRIKGWGKLLITKKLKSKGISERCIRDGLKEIDEEAYENRLTKLAISKIGTSKISSYQVRVKVFRFLFNKGYESDRINSVLDNLANRK